MVIIATHTNADFDTFASMVAAKKLYPNAELVITGAVEKTLKTALKTLKLPYPIRTIDEIDLSKVIRVVLVDVKNKARIGKLSRIIDNNNVEIHIYDHHPIAEGDILGHHMVIKEYGSTATILTHIIKNEKFEISPLEATIIMTGIYEDTGNLTFPTTCVEDFEAASFLLQSGADITKAASLIEREHSRDEATSLGELLKSETVYNIEGVEITIAELDIESFSGEVSFITQRLIDIEGTKCLFVLAHIENRIHLVARSSIKEVDVGKIARLLGGGGHATASSATLTNYTLIETKEKLLAAIKEIIVTPKLAKDIMTSPAITTNADRSVEDALKEMHNFNINALPVVKGSKIVGIITRQVADKATFHGVGGDKVEKFMSSEFQPVSSKTSINNIRDIVMARGQRIIPVVDKERLTGVITRNDLLKLLQEELVEQTSPKDKTKHRNILASMKGQLPDEIIKILKSCGKAADDLGYKAYAVGGFARDIMLRREGQSRNEMWDIDIVIEGDGIKFAKKWARENKYKIKTHERFRSAVVTIPALFKETTESTKNENLKIDIATARLEYYKKPGSLPTIEPSSLKLDLFRRDFTINTLAIALNNKNFAMLIDHFGALKDLKEKNINILHNLSFLEDPTRALRAVRFSVRFGFKISKHTLKLMRSTVRPDLHGKISGARIGDELKNILNETRQLQCLKRASEYNLLDLIDEKLNWDKDREKIFASAIDICKWYKLLYTNIPVKSDLILLIALTENLSNKDLSLFAKRLSFSSALTGKLIKERKSALLVLEKIRKGKYKKTSTLYFTLKGLETELILYIMAKAKTDKTKKLISNYITDLREVKTDVTGKDLKKLGVQAGPKMGKILEVLLIAKLDGKVTTAEEQLQYAKKYINKNK